MRLIYYWTCAIIVAAAALTAHAAETDVRIDDDSGTYFAVIDTANFGPFITPDAADLFAAPATLFRVADGAQVATTVYVISGKACRAGRGSLVWLNESGEPVASAHWVRGADVWPTRVAEVLCARVPGA